MMTEMIARKQALMRELNPTPSVGIVLPFEPKMANSRELKSSLKILLAKVEEEMMAAYPAYEAIPVIIKLQKIFKNLNFDTHKKSLAIFVTPGVEKIFYMNIAVEERLMIDSSFRVRDLVNCKTTNPEYLVLFIHALGSKMWLGNGSLLKLIKSNVNRNPIVLPKRASERSTDFSEPSPSNEGQLKNFEHQMDDGLSVVLRAYPLPVFVFGPIDILDSFSKITRNATSIAAFIPDNCADPGEQNLKELVEPFIANWQEVKEKMVMGNLKKEQHSGKLVYGIDAVRNAAKSFNSSLLAVERNFSFPVEPVELGRVDLGKVCSPDFYIKDSVDAIIQKVLENGGNVEWMHPGSLRDFDHIALIRH
jgi:hypothetical protein